MSRRYRPRRSSPSLEKIHEAAVPKQDLKSDNKVIAPGGQRSSWRPVAVAALLLATVCVVLYGRTLDFPMVFDDEMYLKNNPVSRDPASFSYYANFTEFANKPGKMGLDPDLATNFIMRPVAYATFYLNYWLDGYQPRWYHVINIAIHAANALLVAGLIGLLLVRMGLAQSSVRFISLTAALLFAAHPLATESVTYIVQRFTSLGAFFYLLTLLLYFAAARIEGRGLRWSVRALSVLVLLLGMQTNESTFTAPLVVVLLDVVLLRTPWCAALKGALPLLCCLPVIPVLVFAVSAAQKDGLSWHWAVNITNSKDDPWPYAHYLITQSTVVLGYLRRLFWPSDMNLDPSWTLHRSLLEWPVLRALSIFGTLLAAAGWMLRRRSMDARYALPLVLLVWFLITVFPSSGLVPLPDLMAEHRCYLASIGIFVGMALGLDALRTWTAGRAWLRWSAPALAASVIVAFGIATWQRNEVWRSSVSLWEDTTAKSPGKFRVWANLAVAYAVEGRYEEALACSRKAEALEPRFVRAFIQTVSYLNALNRSQETVAAIQQKVTATPSLGTVADIQYHYAVARYNTGSMEDGFHRLQALVEAAPQHALGHIALGLIYKAQNRQDMALKHMKQAIVLQPSNAMLASLIAETEKQGGLVAK